jgi:hypothetical protein
VNWISAIAWGFVATIVQTIIEAGGRGLGLTRIGMPFMLGTMFTPNRGRSYLVGFAAHVMVGWVAAMVYALLFELWGRATWYGGVLLGVIHGLFVLAVLMPLLPNAHPRMASDIQGPTPTPMLEPPGFFALNYGRNTAVVTLLAHAMYGLILGLWYEPVHAVV